MENNRKTNLYQTATVLFVLVFASFKNGVTGQCVLNPKNVAMLEGTKDIFLDCAPNPTQVNWVCYPTSDELENAQINDEKGVVTSSMRNLYKILSNGLQIFEATIYQGSNMYSTAGICVGQHGNETRLVGAKIVVVHDGPVCTFNVSSPANGVPVMLNCTTSYADHSVHPIRPVFIVTFNGEVVFYETIYPERINQYIFVAWKGIEMAYNACISITVTLKFDAPTDIQYEFMATNEPDYINSVTFPATSDSCLREGANVAVYEGTENVVVGSTRNPQTLQRKVSSTNDQLSTFPISDFDNGVLPNMTKYYAQDKRGLIILKATAVAAANELTTAGIFTELDHAKNLKGFKVVVVRGPPTCSKNVSDANPPKSGDSVELKCAAVFADHSLHQIPPRITFKRNGVSRSTISPSKTRNVGDETFSVAAAHVAPYDAAAVDTCVFNFDPPPSNDGYSYLAPNAPSFSATCSF